MPYTFEIAYTYNKYLTEYVKSIAPCILRFYELSNRTTSRVIVDLCSGPALLALEFLKRDYKVICIDNSEWMLRYATLNTIPYRDPKKVLLVLGDIRDLCFREKTVGFIVSTSTSINELRGIDDLHLTCESIFKVLLDDGYFIFDMYTRSGLEKWDNLVRVDEVDAEITFAGNYHAGKAVVSVSGVVKNESGIRRSIHETFECVLFEWPTLKKMLLEMGWRKVYRAKVPNLQFAIENDSDSDRVFVIAQK